MKRRVLAFWLAMLLATFPFQNLAPSPAQAYGRVFYPQTGFSLAEPFLSGFYRFGGVYGLGYPISRPYESEGIVRQAFQRGILEWKPGENRASLASLMDQLHERGYDDFLLAQGIPRKFTEDDGSGGDFEKAKAIRLRWLTQGEIKLTYFRSSDPVALWGLPTSQPEKHGPFITQRFQKGALQLWVENIPGMPRKGAVVGVLAGEFAKGAGLIPQEALQPEAAPAQEENYHAPPAIYHGRRDSKRVAITIDDAWNAEAVKEVLQIARKHGVKMTFFPVGAVLSRQSDLWKEAVAEGHEVGNHTFTHACLNELSDEGVRWQIRATNAAVDKALGSHHTMKYLRPPGGAGGNGGRLSKLAQEEGLTVVMWSLDPAKSPSTYDYVVSRVQGGDIILLHFIPKDISVLDRLIENLVSRGFELTTVSGLLSGQP